MGSQAERTCGKAVVGEPGWMGWWLADTAAHLHVLINPEEQLGSETDPQPSVPVGK